MSKLMSQVSLMSEIMSFNRIEMTYLSTMYTEQEYIFFKAFDRFAILNS